MRDKTRTAKEAIKELGVPTPKWVPMPRAEIHAIVQSLGGLLKASRFFAVQPCTISKWRTSERLPGWALALHKELTSKSITTPHQT